MNLKCAQALTLGLRLVQQILNTWELLSEQF